MKRNTSIIRINPLYLLAVYSVLVVGVLVVIFDTLVLDGAIRRNGPQDPHEYIWFTVLFTLPHIFASFFGFLDHEYIDAYGDKLTKGIRYIVLASILLLFLPSTVTFVVFALYTMTHVYLQQTGISRSLMRTSNAWHTIWQWSGVLYLFLLYVLIYSDTLTLSTMALIAVSIPLLVTSLVSAVLAQRNSQTKLGRAYMISTATIPFIGLLFYLLDYWLLVIAIPRIIHDVTAYMFYVSHDHNRFAQAGSNVLYRWFSSIGIPVYIASPAISITLAYPFQAGGLGAAILPVLMAVSFFHYYIEGFMWKHGSLHRKYITYSSPKIDLL